MAAISTNPTSPRLRSSAAVDCLIAAGLDSHILLPSSPAYAARQASYWSNGAKTLQPACIVRPQTARDVSQAITALASAGQPFAVRSGGHAQYRGANNIGGQGAVLDLGLMDWTRYDGAREEVDLGPGARWAGVYAELRGFKRVVAGGREGNVGVAGLLLGGGNTYLTARHGFACDNVVAFEVVLADGRIVEADERENSDLFRALKGGSSNFGVVTNFRMKAIESDEVWGGITVYPREVAPEAIRALTEFTNDVEKDVDSNLLLFFTYMGMS